MITSFVKTQNTFSHIAMEMAMAEEDKALILADLQDELAEEAYQKRMHQIETEQGVDMSKVSPELVEGCEFIKLTVFISQFSYEWGLDPHELSGDVLSNVDLPNMRTRKIQFEEELDSREENPGFDVFIIDIRAGQVFATRKNGEVKVLLSVGATVEDEELGVYDITPKISAGQIAYLNSEFDKQQRLIEELDPVIEEDEEEYHSEFDWY